MTWVHVVFIVLSIIMANKSSCVLMVELTNRDSLGIINVIQVLLNFKAGASNAFSWNFTLSAFCLLRNNLSVVDGFLVEGMGAKAELKLNSKLPGPNSNIIFDMKAQHLNDCNSKCLFLSYHTVVVFGQCNASFKIEAVIFWCLATIKCGGTCGV